MDRAIAFIICLLLLSSPCHALSPAWWAAMDKPLTVIYETYNFDDGTIQGWNNGATVDVSTNFVHSNTYSMPVEAIPAASKSVTHIAGTGSAWVYRNGSTCLNTYIKLNGAIIADFTATSNTWVYVTFPFAGSGTDTLSINPSSGCMVYVDDISVPTGTE